MTKIEWAVMIICTVLLSLLIAGVIDYIRNPMPAVVQVVDLKYEVNSSEVTPIYGKDVYFAVTSGGQKFWVEVGWDDRTRWIQVSEPVFKSLRVGDTIYSKVLYEYDPTSTPRPVAEAVEAEVPLHSKGR